MTLSETLRQVVAGLIAASVFAFAYFGLSLATWFSAGAALLGFIAALLLIRRAPPSSERMVAEGVSAQDLDIALRAMRDASGRLHRLTDRSPRGDGDVFRRLGDLLERIGLHHERDPGDLRHTRRFLRHDLPRIVETAEAYVELAARSGAASEARLSQLSAMIDGFVPALERIDQACLENDFVALEVEAEVLSEQLKHR